MTATPIPLWVPAVLTVLCVAGLAVGIWWAVNHEGGHWVRRDRNKRGDR